MQDLRFLTAAVLSSIFAFTAFAGHVHGQSAPGPEAAHNWMRIRSDDGEFAIDIPAKYSYFKHPAGFLIANQGQSGGYLLSDMHIVRGSINDTYVSVEVYEAASGAVDVIYDSDKGGGWQKLSKIKRGNVDIKQLVRQETDTYYAISHYFSRNGKIYVLTAASRKGATPEIARFLSYSFGPAQKGDGSVAFSELKFADVKIEILPEDTEKAKTPTPASIPKVPSKPTLVILRAPRASYVDSARRNNISGAVRLKITLSAEGSVPSITVAKSLPEGLLRQALFAALRIVFLPKEQDGIPVSFIKTIDYTFAIY